MSNSSSSLAQGAHRVAGLGFAAAIGIVALAAGSGGALAAEAPSQIDARVREALERTTFKRDDADPLVTGYEDIILLERRKLFTFHAGVSSQYTSNAFLTDANTEGALFEVGDVGVRADMTFGGVWNVWADVGAMVASYSDVDGLNYTAFNGSLGVSRDFATGFGRLAVSAAYDPSVVFGSGFSGWQLTQHRLGVALNLLTPMNYILRSNNGSAADDFAIAQRFSAERTFANPSDYDNWSGSWDLSLIYSGVRNVQLSTFVGLYVRRYDSYFPGLLGVDTRKDDGLRLGASAIWSPTQNVYLALNLAWMNQDSNSDVSAYEVFTAGPSVNVNLKF